MPPLNEANTLGLELETVDPKVETAFERDHEFLTSIEKNVGVEIQSSREMRVPIELRPNGNTTSFDPNGGDMGTGDGPVFDKAVLTPVYFNHKVEWTQQSDYSTDTSKKAVFSAFRRLLATQLDEFKRNLNSFCMTSGNGVLGTSSAVSAAGGTSGGDRWTLAVAGDGFGARLLRFNMTVGIYNSGLTVKRGEAKVNFYDEENGIVDTTPAVAGVTAGDKLVIGSLASSSPTSLFGVPYHHSNSSSGTWLGFSRSATPEIRANRINAGSSALALPFPRRAINKIGMRVGQDMMRGQGVVAWMHPCQKQAYEELGQLISLIQKSPKEEGLDLYFNDNMQMAGAPVRIDFSWDKTRIDFINASLWGRGEIKKIGFHTDPDGKKIFAKYGQSGGLAAAWLMYYTIGFNLYHRRPAAGSYIDTLTIPTGY